jgi:hypothetical protein
MGIGYQSFRGNEVSNDSPRGDVACCESALCGELIHMDENEACKFPADKLEAVLTNVQALIEEEGARLTALRNASTAAEVRAAFSGHAYSTDDKND